MIPWTPVDKDSAKSGITPLEVFLQQVRSDPDFPACAEHVRAILALSSDLNATIQKFASTIQRDVALTLRILRTANSALYNRSGRPVLSVSHAASLLGLDALVHIAASSRFLEHYAKKSPGIVELVTYSLLSANVSKQLTTKTDGRLSEEAYLAGMLANVGEIVFAYHRPEQYAKIMAACEGKLLAEKVECRKETTFTFDEVGKGVLASFGLHGAPQMAVVVEPEVLKAQAAEDPESRIALAAKLGNIVVGASQRCDEAEKQKLLDHWVNTYGGVFGLTLAQVPKLMERAMDEAKDNLRHLGVRADRLQANDRKVKEPLEEMLGRADGGVDRQSAVALALEAVLDTNMFDRAVFCEVSRSLENMEATGVLGMDAAAARKLFSSSVAFPKRPPLSLAVVMKQDLLVDLLTDGRFRESPFVKAVQPAVFAVLPVVVNRQLAGILYADRKTTCQTDGLLPRLGKIRDGLAHALTLVR
jgi:hypothetical protein